MEKAPKLKITGLGWDASGGLHNLEEAQYFSFNEDMIVTVEDQVVNSYEEILQLASHEPYKDKEYLEVVFLPVIVGGQDEP